MSCARGSVFGEGTIWAQIYGITLNLHGEWKALMAKAFQGEKIGVKKKLSGTFFLWQTFFSGPSGKPGKPRQTGSDNASDASAPFLMAVTVLESFLFYYHSPCSDLNNLTDWKPHCWTIGPQTYQIHNTKSSSGGICLNLILWVRILQGATKCYQTP